MEKFLIRREIKGVSSLSRHDIGEWGKASENILEKMRKEGKKIKQEATYVAGDSMFCVYEAENEDMLNGDGADGDFEFSENAILSGHAQDVKYVVWHPTENLLFSGSYDNTIKCWKYDETVDDWLCSYTMDGHQSTVWQMDFDTTGNFLCSCSEDKKWSIW